MKYLVLVLSISFVIIVQACSGTKAIQQNPLWKDCPFAGLEFTYVQETDSISRSLEFNDSLKVGLESDLKTLEATGKAGNKANATIKRFTSKTSVRRVELDDKEYIEFLQSKVKAICGLNDQLREGKIYTDAESRQQAIALLTSLIESLGNWSEKKTESLKHNTN